MSKGESTIRQRWCAHAFHVCTHAAVLAALAGMFWYGSLSSSRAPNSGTGEAYFSSTMADALRAGDMDAFVSEAGRLKSVDQLDADCATPLLLVANSGNAEAAEYLLSRGANPNVSHAGYGTPLIRAVLLGHVEMVKTLLRYGADASQATLAGDTPLHAAMRCGRGDLLTLLQTHCAAVDLAAKFSGFSA